MLCVNSEMIIFFPIFKSLSHSSALGPPVTLNKTDNVPGHKGKVFSILPLKMIFAINFL